MSRYVNGVFVMNDYEHSVYVGLMARDRAEEKARQTVRDGGKVCTQCKVWKPIEEFYHLSSTTHYGRVSPCADGLQSACKQCRRAMVRAWELANPDKKRANDARYYAAHRERVLARVKTYSADVKRREARRAYLREYYRRRKLAATP